MRQIFEKIIQRKNPTFHFHPNLMTITILSLFLSKIGMKLRAQKIWLNFRRPKGLYLGKNVQFFALNNIKWCNFVQLEDYVFVSGLGLEPVHFSDNVRIGAHSRVIISTTFDQPGKGIFIGKNVGIGEFSYLGGAGGLHIGDDCIIGQYFSTHPENHIFKDSSQPIRLQGTTREGIFIEQNCWIGAKVTLLDGIRIGAGSVVAAGAVVTQSFPAGSVIGGVPARLLSKNQF
jgi:carbonic anhydrase/acetyltransferase-like protein (isoleucine patch superfamily)